MSTRATLTTATLAVVALLLAACTAGGPTPPAVTRAADTPATSAGDPGASAPAAAEPWRTAELRDVRTGERFRIADLAGQLVVIEPMAIWCVNCATQQRQAVKALAALDRDDIVYISLDIDGLEAEPDLAAYADEGGFGWRFVVASREVARSLAQTFGDQVLSPPSTPRIIVTPAGEVVGPDFGIQDAAAIEVELRSHLS